MRIHTNLFLGKGIKKPEKMLKKLNSGKLPAKFYFAAFYNGGDRLEIFMSYFFVQKYYRKQEYEVVGVFKSKDDAFDYVRALSEISVKKYGDFYARKTIDSLSAFELEMLKEKKTNECFDHIT